MNKLFNQPLSIINIGLPRFAESVQAQGVPTLHLDWSPPLVPHYSHTRNGTSIDAANQEAIERLLAGRPMIVGLGLARDVIPNLTNHTILHAGPPIEWEHMCGPTRGAILGALVYEGLAPDPEAAATMVDELHFAPCHHHHAVGPMAGVISPSMPVWIIENATYGNRAYCTLNEGLGKVLRYGAYGEEVYQRLHWMADILYPILAEAVAFSGPIDLRSMIAQALHMGDECHNRNRAGTSLLLRALGPALARTCTNTEYLAQVLEFIDGNDHFFLNLAMPAAKATLEPAEGIEGSTIITIMARNGTDFGIQVSGAAGQWFTAPAAQVDGLYLPGYNEDDANPDIGDSTITETAGYGAFAMAGAPAIASFVGGTAQDAIATTLEMYTICFAEHQHLTIPALEFRGTPLGLDVRLIMETGILPKLNTGIAHKHPGIGMVGAGVLRAPYQSFADAFEAITTW
ncbi:MAG: DUF1116 domain-containing protein [Anaerolineales bacterium]|nr:DUF1116 domain-containing protein [Anaerolineales bacterium]